MIKKWVMQDSKDVFQTPYLTIQQRAYRLPDGRAVADYYHLKRPDYVLVVARDQQQRIMIVRQYRRGVDRVVVELPASWIDKEEAVCEAALRELAEETGFQGRNPIKVGTLVAQPGFSDMAGHVVAAEIQTDEPVDDWSDTISSEPASDEILEYKLVTKQEIDKLIQSGSFCSMGDIAALRMCGL